MKQITYKLQNIIHCPVNITSWLTQQHCVKELHIARIFMEKKLQYSEGFVLEYLEKKKYISIYIHTHIYIYIYI
jgi:hypothetical protein